MKLTKQGLIRINFRDFLPHENKRLRCNFRCSYCNQKNIKQIKFSEKELLSSKRIWDKLSTVEDDIIVRLNFDGEILIDKWAREIWYHINKLPNVKISEIITNNSIDPDDYLGLISLPKASFNCSFHPEFVSLQRFINHALKLKQKGCPLFATMVVLPEMVNELTGIVMGFEDAGILFRPLLLLNTEFYDSKLRNFWKKIIGKSQSSRSYNLYELELIRQHYYSDLEFQFQKGRKTSGLPCFAGVDMINVFLDGSVYRCFGAKLGTIDELCDGKIKLREEPYPCFTDTCQCPTHMIFLKDFRDKYILSDKFADHYEIN
ncbi:MAG: hypothetical protein EHM79_06015 [Geobacter sp.]|nr:MAG: hypothetical protein EHM79_06015 [Geobacter sp.]